MHSVEYYVWKLFMIYCATDIDQMCAKRAMQSEWKFSLFHLIENRNIERALLVRNEMCHYFVFHRRMCVVHCTIPNWKERKSHNFSEIFIDCTHTHALNKIPQDALSQSKQLRYINWKCTILMNQTNNQQTIATRFSFEMVPIIEQNCSNNRKNEQTKRQK